MKRWLESVEQKGNLKCDLTECTMAWCFKKELALKGSDQTEQLYNFTFIWTNLCSVSSGALSKTCLQDEKLYVSLILCLISFKIFNTLETLTCVLVSSSSLLCMCTLLKPNSSVDGSHRNHKLLSLVICETKWFLSVCLHK